MELYLSININDSIVRAVSIDNNNTTNKTIHSNTTFRYFVTFELTKNSANKTIVKYYIKSTYTSNTSYYTTNQLLLLYY